MRKSAIKILWECCIRAPGFPRATDACKHVLMRAGDSEESIQNTVARMFHELWFTSTPAPAEQAAAANGERAAALG